MAELEQVVPWSRLERLIEPHYPKAGNGRQPYPLATWVKVDITALELQEMRKLLPRTGKMDRIQVLCINRN